VVDFEVLGLSGGTWIAAPVEDSSCVLQEEIFIIIQHNHKLINDNVAYHWRRVT
jgi:hypothetical protein